MGHTNWSNEEYTSGSILRAASGRSAFDYNDRVLHSQAEADRAIHNEMNPYQVTRESRDSAAHPNSRPVAVLCDITGSMRNVPRVLQENLPRLMNILLHGRSGQPYLADPQILIGGIGDGSIDPRTQRQTDKAVLQVGQFESGIEIDQDLGKLWLEGGGGGQLSESYELAMYFMLHKTILDCQIKRNQRGFLFIIGDERAYARVNPIEVNRYIGDTLTERLTTASLVTQLLQKWDTYFLIPNSSTNAGTSWLRAHWAGLLGQNVIHMGDPANICEVIASTIGMADGLVDEDGIANDLDAAGTSPSVRAAVVHAVSRLSPGRHARNVRVLPAVEPVS